MAERIDTSQSRISRCLALMDLPATTFDLVQTKDLAPSTALAIAKAHKGDESAIVEASLDAVATGKTRAEVVAEAKPAPELCTVHKTDAADPATSNPFAPVAQPGGTGRALGDPSGWADFPPSTPAAAPAPPRLVGEAGTRPGAATEAHTPGGRPAGGHHTLGREVVWGCDLPSGATISVVLPPGTPGPKIYWALMEAAQFRNAEEKGLTTTHPIGSRVRVDHRANPCHGWTGVVTGYAATGDVECDLDQPSGKPRAWLGEAKHLKVTERPKFERSRKAVPR